MLKWSILVFLTNICLAISLPTPEEKAEITKFHVVSQIQLRYAITDVETHVRNRHNQEKDVFFDMFIPKEAFVSNFSMVIKGKSYEAKVKTKEIAEQTYKESTSTSGLVESKALTTGKQVSNICMGFFSDNSRYIVSFCI